MKRFFCLFFLSLICTSAFAIIPGFDNSIATLNLKTEKVINGIYSRFDNNPEMKQVLMDFDQIFSENIGINPRTDLKNLGLAVIAGDNRFDILVYIDGAFNPAKILAEIEAAADFIPPAAAKKLAIIDIAGKKVISLRDEKKNREYAAWFFNNDTIVLAKANIIRQLLENKIIISEKTDFNQENLNNELFVRIATSSAARALEKIENPMLGPVAAILGMFTHFELTIDKSDLGLTFTCTDDDTAQNLKTFIDGQLAGYRMFVESQIKNLPKPGKQPNWLPKAFSFLINRSMSLMAKKTLEQTKVSTKGSQVFLQSTMPPLTEGLFNPATLGVTGVLAAIAIPNYRKAKETAQTKACFANQRVLAGAVEMFNMDQETPIKNLDENVIRTLVEMKYLSNPPVCPSGGIYHSSGDLNDSGSIRCTIHGEVK